MSRAITIQQAIKQVRVELIDWECDCGGNVIQPGELDDLAWESQTLRWTCCGCSEDVTIEPEDEGDDDWD